MSTINLKWSDGEKKLELEMRDFEQDQLKMVLDKFILQPKEQKTSDVWKEGYQALMKPEVGLHSPESEYQSAGTIKKSEPVTMDNAMEKYEPYTNRTKKDIEHDFKAAMEEKKKKQLYYICDDCRNKGRHFIVERDFINCHACSHKMMVRKATPSGKPDEYGNYYIAGEYNKTLSDVEEEKRFWESRDSGKEKLLSYV